MEKILNNRLNQLNSDLQQAQLVKPSKELNIVTIDVLKIRISEVEWLIYMYNKNNNEKS